MDPAVNPSPSRPKKTPTEDVGGPPSVVPPYWQHRRYESYSSVGHLRPTPIRLEDNVDECPDERSPLWAKGVSIDDYVLVSGNIPSIGDYIVWHCSIEMLDVSFPSSFVLARPRIGS